MISSSIPDEQELKKPPAYCSVAPGEYHTIQIFLTLDPNEHTNFHFFKKLFLKIWFCKNLKLICKTMRQLQKYSSHYQSNTLILI